MIQKLLKRIKKYLFEDKPETVTQRLKPEMGSFKTVFDVGAYKGSFIAEVLKINPAINIHAFEPFNESFEFIKTKYLNNGNVKVNHAAVSDIAGKALLNINAFKETNSLLSSGVVSETIDAFTQHQSTESVEVIQLGEYCLKNGLDFIDLIKIDTQGNSYNVLKGLEDLLIRKKIKYLYVEAEFVEIYKNEKLFSEIEILMRGYGYCIAGIYNLNYIDKQKLGWCDVLFSPENREI